MPCLPNETLDSITDFLHDNPGALKQLCIVSWSRVPRAQMHLFYDVRFEKYEDLRNWKKIFQEPAKSPARYTNSLSFCVTKSFCREDVGWIKSFNRVVRLAVVDNRYMPGSTENHSFTPFHELSPAIKSLHMGWETTPLKPVFDLIYSFPFLEDLSVLNSQRSSYDGPKSYQPLVLPRFTGTLVLGNLGSLFISQLLKLPNQHQLHFRKIVWKCIANCQYSVLNDLVESCSGTLESVDIGCCKLCLFDLYQHVISGTVSDWVSVHSSWH